MKKLVVLVIAFVVGIAIAMPSTANAAELTTSVGVSLPYVEDVNEFGSGYVATVTCAGSSKAVLKVTQSGKRIKVRKHAPRVWTVKLKRAKTYKLSVKVKGGAWKSIAYRIY